MGISAVNLVYSSYTVRTKKSGALQLETHMGKPGNIEETRKLQAKEQSKGHKIDIYI